ncbi:MAG: phosphoadenosine phosphosulfate reductase family protein, partial [Phormidesmis sp.]
MTQYLQTSLFTDTGKEKAIPSFIQTVLADGAALAVSVSGGKDSDAMLRYLAKAQRVQKWSGHIFALFCDLGRIEWPGVETHLQQVCQEVRLPLVKLYPQRSMIEAWQHRHDVILSKQEDKPFWSSAAARFCTKHEKTQPSDRLLRGYNFVVCAVGLRAEESSARAKKPRYQVRNDIASTWYKNPPTCKSAGEKEFWAEEAYQRWLDSGR